MVGRISIENGSLVFELTGVDRMLALKSRLEVPLRHVKSVSTEKADWNYFNMIKVGGARIPGVVEDGRFLGKGGLLFYEMRDPDRCITVELEGEMYKKVVFEVEDKEAAAKAILHSIKR